jgi:hypothetical protein
MAALFPGALGTHLHYSTRRMVFKGLGFSQGRVSNLQPVWVRCHFNRM